MDKEKAMGYPVTGIFTADDEAMCKNEVRSTTRAHLDSFCVLPPIDLALTLVVPARAVSGGLHVVLRRAHVEAPRSHLPRHGAPRGPGTHTMRP